VIINQPDHGLLRSLVCGTVHKLRGVDRIFFEMKLTHKRAVEAIAHRCWWQNQASISRSSLMSNFCLIAFLKAWGGIVRGAQ
jgi:hypothetical protein